MTTPFTTFPIPTTLPSLFTSSTSGIVPASGGGTLTFLRADGTWAVPPGTGGGGGGGTPGGTNGQVQYNNLGSFAGFTVGGDVLLTPSTGVITVVGGAITYSKMQNISANNRILGNVSGAAGPVAELTPTQVTAMLNLFTGSLQGLVPGTSAGSTTAYLRGDGTWAVPAGGGGTAPGGSTGQLQWNNASAFSGMSGTAWDDTNRSLVMTGATVTAIKPILDLTQTWNNNAVPFVAIRLNVTDTQSQVASELLELDVAGVNKFSVRKDGAVTNGIWAATTVGATAGGTAQTTYALGDTLYSSATNTLSKLAGNITSAKQFLSQTGTGSVSAAPAWAGLTPTDTGMPATTVKGGTPTWSNTAGAIVDGQGRVNALAYGADPTGAADSTTAINNALGTGKVVYLPTGTYKTSAPLTITVAGSGLVGDGMDTSIISNTLTTGDAVTVSSGISFVKVRHLTITRPVQAGAGYGLNFATTAASPTVNDNCLVEYVHLKNHNVGLRLGTASYSWVRMVWSSNNASHGVQIDGLPAQWDMNGVFSSVNGGDGFHVVPNNGASGAGQAVLNWINLSTFNNSGYGFYSQYYGALRVSDCFFGSDHFDEVYIGGGNSTAHYSHMLTNIQCETSAAGYGFHFDTAAGSVTCVNCSASFCWFSGLRNDGGTGSDITIHGGRFDNNGQGSVAGTTTGLLNAVNGTMTVVGTKSIVSGTQTSGLVSQAGSIACSIIGGNLPNAAITNAATTAYAAGNY